MLIEKIVFTIINTITKNIANGNRVELRGFGTFGLKELKARQYYEKPSEKKRRKKKEGIANYKKKQAKLLRTRGY